VLSKLTKNNVNLYDKNIVDEYLEYFFNTFGRERTIEEAYNILKIG